MRNDLTLYRTPDTGLARQRLWFTLHVFGYVLFCVIQGALLPFGPLALALRLFLCLTIVLHLGWLYAMSFYASGRHWHTPEYIPQAVPMLIESGVAVRRTALAHDDFWYRWHDVG